MQQYTGTFTITSSNPKDKPLTDDGLRNILDREGFKQVSVSGGPQVLDIPVLAEPQTTDPQITTE